MHSLKRTALTVGAATLLALTATAAMAHGRGHHFHWYPWFGHNLDRLPTFLMEEPDATAQDSFSPGNLWVGSGIPATNMILKANPFADVELSIKAMYRQGGDILPNLVDSDGIVHVQVPAGHQLTPTVRTDRAAWNFTYSYNVGLDGNTQTLDAFEAWLLVDTDPSLHTNYANLRLTRVSATPPSAAGEPDVSGFGWKLGPAVTIGDDEGTAQVTQNSQNYAFGYNPAYAAADFPAAQFDVIMIIKKKHGPKVGELHVVFDVVDDTP